MTRQNEYFPQSVSHPGETLAEKLEEMQMSTKEFAVRSGKPEKTIIAVMKGESSITPDMAIQFEKVTKIPAAFWMKYQAGYDEYKARVKHEQAIEAAIDWTKSFPVAAMVRCGWIARKTTWRDKSAELLNFLGFATHHAWAEYYLNQKLKIAFRISLASTSQPHAISAWLRMGQLQAADLEVAEYNEKEFKSKLTEIKSLMAKHPDDFFVQLQSLCAKAGVKVVYTPCLPKAPINGCTRWINDTPLIQLTGRHKRNDIFWFTFFHEAGHIMLHGKKDIFIEQEGYSGEDMVKEDEANNFAVKWTLSTEEEQMIIDAALLDDDAIYRFAERFITHPAIIVGRLHHRKLIHPSKGRQFIKKMEFE